ncbi:cytochrome P450 family protein [Abortiporus biennis]
MGNSTWILFTDSVTTKYALVLNDWTNLHNLVPYFTLVLLLLLSIILSSSNGTSIPDIRAIGPKRHILSYVGAYRYMRRGEMILKESYNKHKASSFQIPLFDRWVAVISGARLIEELRKASDDVLGAAEAREELVQGTYIFEMKTEIALAFQDLLTGQEEWVTVPALDSLMRVICRINNRLFLDDTICRESDFIDLMTQFVNQVMPTAKVLRRFPGILRPIVSLLASSTSLSRRGVLQYMQPFVQEQIAMVETGQRLPNNFLSWLMEEIEPQNCTDVNICNKLLDLNFSSLYPTAQSAYHLFAHLASHPQHIPLLRDDIEQNLRRQGGWSKDAIDKMRRVESFVKESLRVYSTSSLSLPRLALQPYTFSDGTHIPKGSMISVPSGAIHFNPVYYPDPMKFDPWRFVGDGEVKHQVVATSAEFLTFGHGRHACPGRFFASLQLKTLLAHVVMTYDIRLITPSKGRRPNLDAKDGIKLEDDSIHPFGRGESDEFSP